MSLKEKFFLLDIPRYDRSSLDREYLKKRLGKIAPLPIGLVSAEDNPEEMKINKKRKVTQMKDIFL